MSKMKRISRRELVQKIKMETNNIEIPNLTKEIISNVTYDTSLQPVKKTFNIPLRFASILACSLILVLSIFIFMRNPQRPTRPANTDVSKAHQVYGIQAVTLFNFVDNESISPLRGRKLLRFQNLGRADIDYQKIAQEINDYLLSAVDILNKESVEYLEENSDNPEYSQKMTMKIKMFEHEKTYILYFNESATSDYDDIDEVSSKIKGIIKTDATEFVFEGEKEIEEDEYEVNLRMYLSDDLTEYYEVSQEIEKRENEYSYAYYQNNRLIEETEISIEELNNKKYVELEVFKEGREIELEFNYQDKHILIKYEIDELEGIVKTTLGSKSIIYKFDSQEIEIAK